MKFYAALIALFALFLAAPVLAQENVKFTTEDGWEIAAIYQPASEETQKTVILLHDLGKNKSEFKTFSQKLQAQGFGYLIIDMRGHGDSINKGEYKTFLKTGTDNEFNLMARDITAAINYLGTQKETPPQDIFLTGSGLGANVASKAIALNPDTGGIALLTPSLKTRDVLTMTGIKVNKRPVFIAVSAEDRKQMMEASFIRNAAFLASGEGKVTFMTAFNLRGIEMIEKFLIDEIIQWYRTPQRPEVKPDAPGLEELSSLVITGI